VIGRWRAGLYGGCVALVLAGAVGGVMVPGVGGEAVAMLLIGVGLVGLVCAVFLEIGFSEDRDRRSAASGDRPPALGDDEPVGPSEPAGPSRSAGTAPHGEPARLQTSTRPAREAPHGGPPAHGVARRPARRRPERLRGERRRLR
jgi:hypothetical protein